MSKSQIAERNAVYALQTRVEPAFETSFDLLATAPQGVAKLRELILSLGVRGKFTRQVAESSECSSAPQENRVGREGRKLVDGEQRNDPLTAPAERDARSKLPLGWLFTALGEVVEVLDSLRKPVTKIDRRPGPYPYYGASGVVDYVSAYIFDEPLVLVGEDGAKWGMGENTAFLIAGKCWVNNHAHVLRPIRSVLLDRFLVHLLNAMDLGPFITGMTVPKLNQARLRSVMLALPPIAEQARIVARIEELMQLCDALEAHGWLQDEQHARLVATLFDALAASASAEELAENWQPIATHFDLLLDRPEAVDTLEQTLLQLAVRGLLVPRDPTDEPASKLLARILAEKDRLMVEGEIKRDKPLSPVRVDEQPFEVRVGWAWAPFGTLVNVSSGITLGRKATPAKPVTLPYLRVANVQRWHLNLGHLKAITVAEGELPRFLLNPGDLLITEGGDWDKVGRTCIWKGDIELCLHQNHVFKARGVLPEWLPAWAELYLNSADARTFFAGASKQTTNLASINSTQLKSCPFPVPPLAEQHRILARVEQLRRLCADLRKRLQQVRTTQSRLADALVVQAGQSQAGRGTWDNRLLEVTLKED